MPITSPIHISYSELYPKGYTTAKSNKEATQVAMALVEATKKSWSVISGMLYWKTGKPSFWIIYTTEDEK